MIWNDASNVLLAGVQATKVVAGTGTGTVDVWTAWSGAGMEKTADQTIANETRAALMSMAAMAAYPDTVMSGPALYVPAGTYRIQAQITWAKMRSGDGYTYNLYVDLDGSTVAQSVFPSTGSLDPVSFGIDETVTVEGGYLSLYAYTNGSLSTYRVVLADGTWLTVTKP